MCQYFLSIRLSGASIDSKRILHTMCASLLLYFLLAVVRKWMLQIDAPPVENFWLRHCIVHQSLVGLAPAYLADDCRLLSDVGRRPLRSNSNDMRKLLVLRTHNKLGDRSFSAAGPRLWNDLDYGGRDLPSTLSDNLWKLIYLTTEALSDSFEFIGAI